MDKLKFELKMNETKYDSIQFDSDKIIDKSIKSTISKLGGDGNYNLIIVMEELNELGQQVSKFIRGKSEHLNLIEEMADVSIGLIYLKHICKISDDELSKAINIKLERLNEVIEAKGMFR